MVSQRILPYDVSEGPNEKEARLAAGRETIDAGRQPEGTGANINEGQSGQSDSVSLGTGSVTSDVSNLLEVSQEPMDVIWAGELVNVPDGDETQNTAQPPEADVLILDPPSRPPQAVSVEPGVTRAGNVPRWRIRSVATPPSQTESAATLMIPPPSTPILFLADELVCY